MLSHHSGVDSANLWILIVSFFISFFVLGYLRLYVLRVVRRGYSPCVVKPVKPVYDLSGNVLIESRLMAAIDAMNIDFMRLPGGSVEQLELGVKINLLVNALYAVHEANDLVERVNFVVEGVSHG